MKHGKAILSGLVGLLALGVISTTIALYVKAPDEQSISINGSSGANGIYTLDKDLTTSTEGEFALAPGLTYVADYNMGMEVKNNSYTQKIAVGKVTITINDPDGLFNYMDVSAIIDGYNFVDASSYMLKTEENSEIARNVFSFKQEDTTYTAIKEVPFSIDSNSYGTQSVKLEFRLKDSVEDDVFLNQLADKSIDYKIDLTDTTDFTYAYVRGSFEDSKWEPVEKYRMVPNIKADHEQWMYTDITLTSGDTLKCYISKDKNGVERWSYNKTNNYGASETDGNVLVNDSIAGENTLYWDATDSNNEVQFHTKK